MTLVQIIVLALVQGITEFLPVSSSAHLILGSKVFGWPDQGLVFDVATHLGTLFAVLFYFRAQLSDMVRAWRRPSDGPGEEENRAMGKYLLLASIPAILAGALFHDWVEAYLRDVRVIAMTTLVFGLLLWVADAVFPRNRELGEMKLKPALAIGLAQVLALVPGASRSGVTITMGRMLGFGATSAARFSFLLAVPVIAAAGVYGLLRMLAQDAALDWAQFGLAVVFSAVAGWICIAAFLAALSRIGLLPFVTYRLVLGLFLLYLAF